METGKIVLSLAGNDRGQFYCVVGMREDRILVADGKRRKLDAPKEKSIRHLQSVGTSAHPAILRLQRGEPVTDRQLRRALAAFRLSDSKGGT